MKKVYDTANFYHFIHTVALLAVPLSRKPVLVSEEYINRICMADMELPRSKVRELMERPVYPTPQEPVSRYGYENWSFRLALEIWNLFQTGALMVSGMTVFCGTIYYHALTEEKSLRKFTPYGGMLLIAAWLSMVV